MKCIKHLVLLWIFSFLLFPTKAQKWGLVDTEYVLGQLPEYKKAQAELEKVSLEWEEEIKTMTKESEQMEIKFHAEEILLTVELRKERKESIDKKFEEIKEYNKKVFGFEGLYFLKKKELMKPVQDKVAEAIDKVRKSQRLGILLDKSSDLVVLYVDPTHDYTDLVLESLGLNNDNSVVDEENTKNKKQKSKKE